MAPCSGEQRGGPHPEARVLLRVRVQPGVGVLRGPRQLPVRVGASRRLHRRAVEDAGGARARQHRICAFTHSLYRSINLFIYRQIIIVGRRKTGKEADSGPLSEVGVANVEWLDGNGNPVCPPPARRH